MISHIFREAEGGIPRILDALSGYDQEDAQAFMEKYNSVSLSDRDRLSLEEICVAAGVKTLDLLAAVVKALFLEGQTISSIIASTSHPKVVRKTVEMALEPGGHRDREMLHTSQGFLPTPKGSTFISNRFQIANFSEGGQPGVPATPELPDVEDLPSMDDDIQGMDDIERKLLEAPK